LGPGSRGRLVDVLPDPEAAYFVHLSERYGKGSQVPGDAADRVVLVMSLEHFTTQ